MTKTFANGVTCVHLAPVRCTLTLFLCRVCLRALVDPQAGGCDGAQQHAGAVSPWAELVPGASQRVGRLGRRASDTWAGLALSCLWAGALSGRLPLMPVMCPICLYPAVASLSLRQQTPSRQGPRGEAGWGGEGL